MTTDDQSVSDDLAFVLAQARTFALATPDDYQRACEFLLAIKQLRSKVAATFDEHISRAFQAHRALVKEKQDAEHNLVIAEDVVKDAIVEWDTRQARVRELERLRHVEAQHEIAQRVEADAAAAEAEGDYARADALRALPPAPPVPLATTPKVEGVSLRETWTARVVDLGALVKAAANHTPWLALLNPNMPALNAQARSLKARLCIPGVEAICSKDVAARRTSTPRSHVTD